MAGSKLQKYRDMPQEEVKRIHSGMRIIDSESRDGAEVVADLICFYGSSWPSVIQKALELAKASQQGDK